MTQDRRPAAPPIPNDTSFYLRFFEDVSGVRDDAGRPLHEVDFRGELEAGDARRCLYHGSRHGRMMNRSAWKAIAKDWGGIRAGMRFLASAVRLERFAEDPGTLVWARSLAPMFLPLYLLRKPDPSGQTVTLPNVVSGLFKVALDVPTTMDLMLAGEWSGAVSVDADSYSPASIAEYAERSGILNNGEWACAGPPALIDDLLAQLWPSHRGEEEEAASIASLISVEDFEAFVSVMIERYALSQAFQVCTSFLMERAFSRLTGNREDSYVAETPLSAYERRRRILLEICRSEVAVARVVSRYSEIAARRDGDGQGVRSEAPAAMLDAIADSAGKTEAELLAAQLGVEEAFTAAIAESQRRAHTVLGAGAGGYRPLDLSRLGRVDFPTVILRQRLRGGGAGPPW